MFQDSTVLREGIHAGTNVSPSFQQSSLVDAGNTIRLQRLGYNFIDRMVELQKTDTSGNTIFRSAEFIRSMLERGDTAFGFVTNDDELVAQAIVRSDMDLLPDALRAKFNKASGVHAYIGSIVVDPRYQGQGLMVQLVEECLLKAVMMGNTDVHARVVVGNARCVKNFTKRFDFEIIMTDQSPDAVEPRMVHFMHRKL